MPGALLAAELHRAAGDVEVGGEVVVLAQMDVDDGGARLIGALRSFRDLFRGPGHGRGVLLGGRGAGERSGDDGVHVAMPPRQDCLRFSGALYVNGRAPPLLHLKQAGVGGHARGGGSDEPLGGEDVDTAGDVGRVAGVAEGKVVRAGLERVHRARSEPSPWTERPGSPSHGRCMRGRGHPSRRLERQRPRG